MVSVEAVGCHQERAARFAQQLAFGMRKEALKTTASEQDSLPSGSQEDHLQLKCGRLQQVTAVVGCMHAWRTHSLIHTLCSCHELLEMEAVHIHQVYYPCMFCASVYTSL